MNIEVRLFATFRKGRWKSKHLKLSQDTSIKDILVQLNINEEELGIALVNGRHSGVKTILKDGDVLSLFPPIGGG